MFEFRLLLSRARFSDKLQFKLDVAEDDDDWADSKEIGNRDMDETPVRGFNEGETLTDGFGNVMSLQVFSPVVQVSRPAPQHFSKRLIVISGSNNIVELLLPKLGFVLCK